MDTLRLPHPVKPRPVGDLFVDHRRNAGYARRAASNEPRPVLRTPASTGWPGPSRAARISALVASAAATAVFMGGVVALFASLT